MSRKCRGIDLLELRGTLFTNWTNTFFSFLGVLTLDLFAMGLQVIVEPVKSIEKLDGSFFLKFPDVEEATLDMLRDIISDLKNESRAGRLWLGER